MCGINQINLPFFPLKTISDRNTYSCNLMLSPFLTHVSTICFSIALYVDWSSTHLWDVGEFCSLEHIKWQHIFRRASQFYSRSIICLYWRMIVCLSVVPWKLFIHSCMTLYAIKCGRRINSCVVLNCIRMWLWVATVQNTKNDRLIRVPAKAIKGFLN